MEDPWSVEGSESLLEVLSVLLPGGSLFDLFPGLRGISEGFFAERGVAGLPDFCEGFLPEEVMMGSRDISEWLSLER